MPRGRVRRAASKTGAAGKAPRAAALVAAAGEADVGALKVLVGRGGDVNASWRNYRPLHALLQENAHAAAPGRVEPKRVTYLKWLLAHRADARRKDAEGITPFELARAKGKPQLIALFR